MLRALLGELGGGGAKQEELQGTTLELDNHQSLGTTRLMGGSCLLCTHPRPGTQQVLHRGF